MNCKLKKDEDPNKVDCPLQFCAPTTLHIYTRELCSIEQLKRSVRAYMRILRMVIILHGKNNTVQEMALFWVPCHDLDISCLLFHYYFFLFSSQ